MLSCSRMHSHPVATAAIHAPLCSGRLRPLLRLVIGAKAAGAVLGRVALLRCCRRQVGKCIFRDVIENAMAADMSVGTFLSHSTQLRVLRRLQLGQAHVVELQSEAEGLQSG